MDEGDMTRILSHGRSRPGPIAALTQRAQRSRVGRAARPSPARAPSDPVGVDVASAAYNLVALRHRNCFLEQALDSSPS